MSINFILFALLVMRFTVFPVLFVSDSEPVVLVIIGIIVLVPVVVFFVWVGLTTRACGTSSARTR